MGLRRFAEFPKEAPKLKDGELRLYAPLVTLDVQAPAASAFQPEVAQRQRRPTRHDDRGLDELCHIRGSRAGPGRYRRAEHLIVDSRRRWPGSRSIRLFLP